MKSKRLLIPIIILIFSGVVAIYVIMGLNYVDQQSEQTNLIRQIKQLTPVQEKSKSTSESRVSIQELQQRLEAAVARVEEGGAPLNIGLYSTDIFDNILSIADQSKLNSYSVRALSSYEEPVGDDVYTVLGFNVLAEGNPSDITAFIGQLENGGMQTLTVENISLTESSEFWTVGLGLSIFTNPTPVIVADELEEENNG